MTIKKNPYHPGIRKKDARYKGYGWFYVPSWNICIVAAPKAGSSSLKAFMSDNDIECKYIKHNEAKKLSCEKFAVIRNPISRFASLWKSKCRDKAPIVDDDVHGLSPRALVAHISSGKKDVHWTPQAELFKDIDVTLIPLENLNDWWEARGYGKLEVVNETTGKMPMNEVIHQWLCNYYAEDFILYAKAHGFS